MAEAIVSIAAVSSLARLAVKSCHALTNLTPAKSAKIELSKLKVELESHHRRMLILRSMIGTGLFLGTGGLSNSSGFASDQSQLSDVRPRDIDYLDRGPHGSLLNQDDPLQFFTPGVMTVKPLESHQLGGFGTVGGPLLCHFCSPESPAGYLDFTKRHNHIATHHKSHASHASSTELKHKRFSSNLFGALRVQEPYVSYETEHLHPPSSTVMIVGGVTMAYGLLAFVVYTTTMGILEVLDLIDLRSFMASRKSRVYGIELLSVLLEVLFLVLFYRVSMLDQPKSFLNSGYISSITSLGGTLLAYAMMIGLTWGPRFYTHSQFAHACRSRAISLRQKNDLNMWHPDQYGSASNSSASGTFVFDTLWRAFISIGAVKCLVSLFVRLSWMKKDSSTRKMARHDSEINLLVEAPKCGDIGTFIQPTVEALRLAIARYEQFHTKSSSMLIGDVFPERHRSRYASLETSEDCVRDLGDNSDTHERRSLTSPLVNSGLPSQSVLSTGTQLLNHLGAKWLRHFKTSKLALKFPLMLGTT